MKVIQIIEWDGALAVLTDEHRIFYDTVAGWKEYSLPPGCEPVKQPEPDEGD